MRIFESIFFAQSGLFFTALPPNMPLMRNTMIHKISVSLLVAGYTLCTLGSAASPQSTSNNIWQTLSKKMSLSSYSSNPSVQKKIRWFLAHQDVLTSFNHNAQPYIHYVSQQVEQKGLPMELAFLPMIESSYQPNVHSSANALGLWQLEPNTARELGVSVNRWYDGRKDVASSTHAALAYLSYLHDYFHNWPLALAAYNAGIGTVSKAIAYNKAHHRSTDYWSLPLPKETRDYVPKLLAVATIFSNQNTYNVAMQTPTPATGLTPVSMPSRMTVNQLAKLAQIDLATLMKLNPSLKNSHASLAQNANVLLPSDKARVLAPKLAAYTPSNTVEG